MFPSLDLLRNFIVVTLLIFGVLGSVFAAEESDVVLIQYEDAQVTLSEFNSLLQKIPEDKRAGFMTDSKRIRQTVANLFVQKKLVEEAKLAGADLDPEIALRVALASEKELASAYLEQIVGEAAQPDFELLAKEEYLADSSRFIQSEMVRVAHILIPSDPASEKALDEVQDKISDGEVDFLELAEAYSADPSVAQNAGDLGYFSRGQMVPEFEAVAFAMTEPGEISGPVKTEFGYHIIKFLDRKPEEQQSFDAVKSVLIEEIKKRHLQQARQAELTRIRSLDGIVVNDEAIQKLQTRPTISGG